jgi:hypothetical protein
MFLLGGMVGQGRICCGILYDVIWDNVVRYGMVWRGMVMSGTVME